MSNRLEDAVSPDERIDFLVRRLTPNFRQSAWVEPHDDGTIDIHMALIRSKSMTVRRGPGLEIGTMNFTAIADSAVIANVPAATERAQMINTAEGHLSDMLQRAQAIMQQAELIRQEGEIPLLQPPPSPPSLDVSLGG